MADSLHLQVVAADGDTLRLIGELDVETAAVFEAAVLEASKANGSVTLDLSELSFIDTCGLHTLAACASNLNGGRPLTMINVPSFAHRVFEVVGLDKHGAVEIR